MKMNPPGDHLTDEQLSDLLDGALPADAFAAHLAACDMCRTKLGDLRAIQRGLAAMRTVGDVPDFRLAPDGTSRRSPAPRVPAPAARRPLAARFVGMATLLCGLALLAVAFFSTTVVHESLQFGAAATDVNQRPVAAPACTTPTCPAAGMAPTPSPGYSADAPTATPVVSATTSVPPTHTTGDSAPTFSPVPLEWGLGVVLTVGGLALVARRPRPAKP